MVLRVLRRGTSVRRDFTSDLASMRVFARQRQLRAVLPIALARLRRWTDAALRARAAERKQAARVVKRRVGTLE